MLSYSPENKIFSFCIIVNNKPIADNIFFFFVLCFIVIEASITSRATLANGHSKIIVNVTDIMKSGKDDYLFMK